MFSLNPFGRAKRSSRKSEPATGGMRDGYGVGRRVVTHRVLAGVCARTVAGGRNLAAGICLFDDLFKFQSGSRRRVQLGFVVDLIDPRIVLGVILKQSRGGF